MIPCEVFQDSELSRTELRVLIALFSFRKKNTELVWPSRAAIAKRANYENVATVSRTTRGLEEKGWIEKRGGSYQGPNKWVLRVPDRLLTDAEIEDSNSDQGGHDRSPANSDQGSHPNSDHGGHANSDLRTSHGTDKEQTIEQTRGPEPGRPDSGSACPHQEIIRIYHEVLPSLRRVRDWNEIRQGYLRSRWRESCRRQSLDWWRKFFEYIGRSDFLMGRAEPSPGRRPFQADLEWIVRPTNFANISEGKYHS